MGTARGARRWGIRVARRDAAGRAARQRAETYIVISKPKRKSVAVGVCHCMESLLVKFAAAGRQPRAAIHNPCPMLGQAGRRDEIRTLDSLLMNFMNLPRCPVATPAAVHDVAATELDPTVPRVGVLEVGDGHRLHVETRGRPAAPVALVLHGGPGSGLSPRLFDAFDLAQWRVVGLDQRGAGRSLPAGELRANRTAELLSDLRRLRAMLGAPRWLVVGGSWGATLALLHALDDPAAVDGLLLRNPFLARPTDIDAFFASAPEALRAGWRDLPELDSRRAAGLAIEWWRHEQRLATGVAPGGPPPPATALLQRLRIQAHYLRAGCWLPSPTWLDRLDALPVVPTLVLQGADDRVCPAQGACEIAARLPQAALRILPGVGHDPSHPAMAAAMREALASFARQGDFGVVR